jgi:hypothetical protein
MIGIGRYIMRIPEDLKYTHESGTSHRNVLLLDRDYQVIRIIHWQKAVSLYCGMKAVAPFGYSHVYRIKSLDGDFLLPSALILDSRVDIPYHHIRPTRKNIFRRDGLICQYTGKQLSFSDASIDHILPQSRGGKDTWENMVTCEKRLNQRKGDRTPKEARLELLRTPRKPTRAELVLGAYRNVEPWKQFLPK